MADYRGRPTTILGKLAGAVIDYVGKPLAFAAAGLGIIGTQPGCYSTNAEAEAELRQEFRAESDLTALPTRLTPLLNDNQRNPAAVAAGGPEPTDYRDQLLGQLRLLGSQGHLDVNAAGHPRRVHADGRLTYDTNIGGLTGPIISASVAYSPVATLTSASLAPATAPGSLATIPSGTALPTGGIVRVTRDSDTGYGGERTDTIFLDETLYNQTPADALARGTLRTQNRRGSFFLDRVVRSSLDETLTAQALVAAVSSSGTTTLLGDGEVPGDAGYQFSDIAIVAGGVAAGTAAVTSSRTFPLYNDPDTALDIAWVTSSLPAARHARIRLGTAADPFVEFSRNVDYGGQLGRGKAVSRWAVDPTELTGLRSRILSSFPTDENSVDFGPVGDFYDGTFVRGPARLAEAPETGYEHWRENHGLLPRADLRQEGDSGGTRALRFAAGTVLNPLSAIPGLAAINSGTVNQPYKPEEMGFLGLGLLTDSAKVNAHGIYGTEAGQDLELDNEWYDPRVMTTRAFRGVREGLGLWALRKSTGRLAEQAWGDTKEDRSWYNYPLGFGASLLHLALGAPDWAGQQLGNYLPGGYRSSQVFGNFGVGEPSPVYESEDNGGLSMEESIEQGLGTLGVNGAVFGGLLKDSGSSNGGTGEGSITGGDHL